MHSSPYANQREYVFLTYHKIVYLINKILRNLKIDCIYRYTFFCLEYFLSRKGGLCANIKTVTFSAVNTLKECKIAVATIQKTVSTAKFAAEETDANWPKGCYLYIVTNGVYFNKDSAGKAHDSARQICFG